MRTRRIALTLGVAAVVAAGLVLGTALAQNGGSSGPKSWTTVFKSPIGIEGLTLDDDGNLYVPQRGSDGCNIVRISSTGGANQAGLVVARMDTPCSPAGLAFGPDERLYLTGFGAGGGAIGVVRPRSSSSEPVPVATSFATNTPGANGLAFDDDGNLYVSDGVTAEGRVSRVGRSGGPATVLFRIQPMANEFGVGRQNAPLPTGAPQGIVANGLAFDRNDNLYVADTARGALWRVELTNRGEVRTSTNCDTTFPTNVLCLDAVFAQHPALDGADGIALDRGGNIWVDANERNAIVVVDR